MNHRDFYLTCAFLNLPAGTSERELLSKPLSCHIFSNGPKMTSLIAAYSVADDYSYNLGYNLVVDSQLVQLFLPSGRYCSQLLNVNAQMSIPALNGTLWI